MCPCSASSRHPVSYTHLDVYKRQDTWYLRAEEGAKWACEKAGAEFISVNSNRDSEQEQTNIDYLIDEGVDCIISLSWNEAGSVSTARCV